MTYDGLYIIIPAVSTLLDGTLVVAWGSWVLEWSSSPHEGLDTLYKETCSPGADCCSIAPLRFQRGCSMVFEWCWGVLKMVLSDLPEAIINCSL